MTTKILGWASAALLFLFCALTPMPAQTADLVSSPASAQGIPAGGAGESGAPIITPDGRYVLFLSSAGNLVTAANNTALRGNPSAPMNVFLRDRTLGTTRLVSINADETGYGNDNSIPADLSTNGAYAAFESDASNLVADDTNECTDVFVRDLTNETTVLVSVNTNGMAGNAASRSAVMTPDGRYVAFVSLANDLVPRDTNGIADVFVRDLQAGVTVLASALAIRRYADSISEAPRITPDGKYVVFSSTATNLVPQTVNTRDIYVRNLAAGTTTWASKEAKSIAAQAMGVSIGSCYNHAISDDGQFVVYETTVSGYSALANSALVLRYNLTSNSTELAATNAEAVQNLLVEERTLDITPDGQHIVFVATTNYSSSFTTFIQLWDAATGTTSLLSGGSNGQRAERCKCSWPRIDPTGQWVVFNSNATNLAPGTVSEEWHFYLRNLQGATTMLDADTNGVGSNVNPLSVARLSADGRFAIFECEDGNLVLNDFNRASDVFVRDLSTGDIDLVSSPHPSLTSLTPDGQSLIRPNCFSADGSLLVFSSESGNLTTDDTNDCRDIFMHDRATGTNLLLSTGWDGASGNSFSSDPSISADGRYVAFSSQASNLIAGDTNRAMDVFVRDLQIGVTILASVSSDGKGQGNLPSYSPAIASDGRYVLFRSKASNLAPGNYTSGAENLFIRDLQATMTYALTRNGLSCSATTPDGHFVAYVGTGSFLYVWDSVAAQIIYTNTTSSIGTVAISPDGNRVVYGSSTLPGSLMATDRLAGTTTTIVTNWLKADAAGLRFSADSRCVVHAATLNKVNQVYLYDFPGGTNLLVSHAYGTDTPADGSSDFPTLSTDGRFVAYKSTANNIVPGTTGGTQNIFLFDRQTGQNTVLSVSVFESSTANSASATPAFSADSRSLAFQTWASDMIEADFNRYSDIVAFSLHPSGPIPVFTATLVLNPLGQGPQIRWQTEPGKSYRVEFKNHLGDTEWHDLGGNVVINGNQASCDDLTSAPAERFYRIVGF